MTTLEDAWNWYEAVRAGMNQLTHLAKYWSDFPWGEDLPWITRLERDNVLRDLEPVTMVQGAETVLH